MVDENVTLPEHPRVLPENALSQNQGTPTQIARNCVIFLENNTTILFKHIHNYKLYLIHFFYFWNNNFNSFDWFRL